MSKNPSAGSGQAAFPQRGGQPGRAAVHAGRDRGQPAGAVVHRVHRGHHGQQHLRGADVAGRLLPADVLLAGLQRQPVGGPAVRVQGDAHQPAGQLPAQVVPGRDVRRVRAAVAHRHAEPLGAADRDVGAQLTGRRQQGQRQQVGGDRGERAPAVRGVDGRAQVPDLAAGPRVLQQDPEQLTRRAGPRSAPG